MGALARHTHRGGRGGTGAFGAELARALTAAGVTVVDVDRSDRKTRRMKGKSEAIDPYAATTAVCLGAGHTYALPGADRLTLAVGDAVRVRVNDYRSGPDLLNGYRAVVSEIAPDGRIEITWRNRTRRPDEAAFLSAWLTPDQVASGALSLGYAMTIAASQSMTCDTSLLYGHGANAFATYPGLTRGK
ncbi:hypothetical protein ACFYT4_26645 [Streptomyces sp. NPDC004609]|uniref:hypothetical protein n=1 Tax=Streptomyces sp. NPDC004609 TaxID=3364704 RepID=UPI0036B39A31